MDEAQKLVENAKMYFIKKYKIDERAKNVHRNATAEIIETLGEKLKVAYKIKDLVLNEDEIEPTDDIDRAIATMINKIHSDMRRIKSIKNEIEDVEKEIEKEISELRERYNTDDIKELLKREKETEKRRLQVRLEELSKQKDELKRELEKLRKEKKKKEKELNELLKEFNILRKRVARKLLELKLKNKNEILKKVKTAILSYSMYYNLRDLIENIALAKYDIDHYTEKEITLCAYDNNNIEIYHEKISIDVIRKLALRDEDAYKLIVVANKLKQFRVYKEEFTNKIRSEYIDELEDRITEIEDKISETDKEILSLKYAIENEKFDYLKSEKILKKMKEKEELAKELEKLNQKLKEHVETLEVLLDM